VSHFKGYMIHLVMVCLTFTVSFLRSSLKIQNIKQFIMGLCVCHTEHAAMLWAKCTHCQYTHIMLFYQLRTDEELMKCVNESKQCQEFLHHTHI